jgi:hypothetical protein
MSVKGQGSVGSHSIHVTTEGAIFNWAIHSIILTVHMNRLIFMELSVLSVLIQSCHTKEEYEEHGASICRTSTVFKGMY